MEEFKLSQLIRQEDLAKGLGVDIRTLNEWRRKGCPWISIGKRIYYHEGTFVEWVVKNGSKRMLDGEEGEIGQ